MSYDLVFWRQDGSIDASPGSIYRELIEGRRVDGVDELDVESFLNAVLRSFPGASREPNGESEWIDWSAPGRDAGFQVEWSSQHVLVCCRRTSNEEMNRLIDIGVTHGCRLY